MTEETLKIPTPAPAPKAEKAPAPKAEKAPAPKAPKVKGVEYSYIGGGETSPMVIKFMSKIDFMIGEVTVVPDTPENEMILQKLEGNPCFIKGKVDKKQIIDQEVAAKEKADKQRKEDKKINARASKNRGK